MLALPSLRAHQRRRTREGQEIVFRLTMFSWELLCSVVLEAGVFRLLALDPRKGFFSGCNGIKLSLLGAIRPELCDLGFAVLDAPAQLGDGQIALDDAGHQDGHLSFALGHRFA